MAAKILYIADLEENPDSTEPIWVLNSSDKSEAEQIGELLIGIPKLNGNGDPDILRIPQTWIPIQATAQIARKQLVNSTQFRQAIEGRLITCIEPSYAKKMLQQVGAKDEQERLLEMRKQIRRAGAPRTIQDSGAQITRVDGLDENGEVPNVVKTSVYGQDERMDITANVASEASNGLEDHAPGISTSFKMWVDRLCVKASDKEVMIDIRARKNFKKSELVFLLEALKDSGKFPQAVKFVSGNIK